MSFDPSYHSEFSALIENVNGEADKSALKNGDLDFEKENEKLEKLHDKVIAESNDPIFPLIVTWIQQRRICEQLADFLSLKGVAGRLTDLQGRATDLQTQGSPKKALAYDSVYMAGRKPDMLIRFALSYPFIHAQLKIKTYDPYKKIYVSSDTFELTSVDSLDYLITREDLAYVLENYRNLYGEIGRLALAYERDGGGPRAREIAANANAGFSTARHALEYSSSPLTHFFAAVDPSEKGKLGASVFGISVLRRNPGIHDSTVEVHSIIAHPFSQIRDDEDFIGYVFRHRHSDAWRRNILSKYRLAGIGHFLADHTIKYAATNIPGIKRIVADTINPRSRIIAAAYGMKKIDELAVYEEMVGPQYLLNTRIYLSDLFRHGRFQTSPLSPGAGTSGAVSPAATDIELENLLVGRIAGATGKGIIYLKPDRANRSFPWLFKFARSDSEVKHDSPQSSAALNTLEPYNIQLGRGSDIVSYPKGSGVSYGDFWSGDNTQLDQLDVLQIPGGNNGANGIRISFAELVAGRPLLVSSGALAGSTQVVGIRTSEGAIYIYQAGKFTSASNWRTGVDGVKDIAHVHHVLTEGKSSLTLPDNPTNADLRGLSVFFDKIYIISNTPQTPGSLSRIDRTDAYRWVYNYQKKDNIFAIANSQFLILKNKQNEISIEGYVESGLIGDKPSKQIGMRASNQIERYFSKSVPPVSAEASRDLSYLTAKIMADPSLTYFFPLSRPDTAVAAKAVMLALRGAGRSVKCRVVLIWGVPDSIEPQVLHVIIDDTGKTPLAIDITAGRLAAYRFPFLGTEEIWARQTKKAFPRSFVAYQDFDSTDEIDKILLIGISDTDTAVGAMTALNVPEWHVQELECSMYPYTATDTTNVKINLRINGKNEIDLDPKWKVDVSVQGLDYATNEGVFRGVYSKTERLRKKYYIKSKSNVYQVELNKNRSGWNLKISDLVEQPKTPIAVWRKDDGRWVTGESETGVGLNPVAPSGGGFPHARAFDLLLGNLADIKINRALWHHDYDTRVVDRNAADISKYIDDEVRGWGTLKQYKDLFGFNPYDFLEPLSALSAINMFKLMVEERIAINPTMLQKTDFADFPAVLGSLDHQKNYVFLVNDARLLQSYLIDVPAGPETKAYILQSNSAQHVMPELKFKDWLTTRAKESISVQDILALMRGDFVHLSGREQRALLASIFDLHKNPDAVNLSRLRSDKGATFIMQAYDPASFLLNVQQLMDNNLKA